MEEKLSAIQMAVKTKMPSAAAHTGLDYLHFYIQSSIMSIKEEKELGMFPKVR